MGINQVRRSTFFFFFLLSSSPFFLSFPLPLPPTLKARRKLVGNFLPSSAETDTERERKGGKEGRKGRKVSLVLGSLHFYCPLLQERKR